jgi:hypothetical protein
VKIANAQNERQVRNNRLRLVTDLLQCDGKSPCRACIDKGLSCVLDESRDGRRGRKRTLDELHVKSDAFDTLVESIRTKDDLAISNLITLIQNGASPDEIVSRAQEILENRPARPAPNNTKSSVMSLAVIADEPPFRVPARPWTLLTADEDFVSHMISVYFTWHHESYPCVDKNLFLASMTAKDVNSQFCSPFLVNCMLLSASVGHTHPRF